MYGGTFHRIALSAALAFAATGCFRVIEDGEVGLSNFLGSISDRPMDTGLSFTIPLVRWVEVWDVKLAEFKETIEVPTSEGMLVSLDASVLFRPIAEQVPAIRKTIGSDFETRFVTPTARSVLRESVSGYRVSAIYSEEGRREITASALSKLREEFEPRGFRVESVLLRNVKLPPKFVESVEAKMAAEQQVQQKQFELEKAEKDAEIEVAKARGAAQAQEIVQSTLTERYLQYLWISTLNDNPNVVYVATEANLPIFKGAQ